MAAAVCYCMVGERQSVVPLEVVAGAGTQKHTSMYCSCAEMAIFDSNYNLLKKMVEALIHVGTVFII